MVDRKAEISACHDSKVCFHHPSRMNLRQVLFSSSLLREWCQLDSMAGVMPLLALDSASNECLQKERDRSLSHSWELNYQAHPDLPSKFLWFQVAGWELAELSNTSGDLPATCPSFSSGQHGQHSCGQKAVFTIPIWKPQILSSFQPYPTHLFPNLSGNAGFWGLIWQLNCYGSFSLICKQLDKYKDQQLSLCAKHSASLGPEHTEKWENLILIRGGGRIHTIAPLLYKASIRENEGGSNEIEKCGCWGEAA